MNEKGNILLGVLLVLGIVVIGFILLGNIDLNTVITTVMNSGKDCMVYTYQNGVTETICK